MRLRVLLLLPLLALALPLRAQFATTEVSPPGATTPFRITKSLWTWEDLGPGIQYSVYRSDRTSTGFECILDRHPSASWTGDTAAFPASRLFSYLVTAYDGQDDNLPGYRSDAVLRALDVPCPRSRACCFADGTCGDLLPDDCATAGGTPQADLTDCATTTCAVPCASGTPVPGRVPLQLVSIGAAFDFPIALQAPAGDPRLFILERRGRIRIQFPDGSRTQFLDFTARVPSVASERGALGLAFHPDYATTGTFYVFYNAAPTGACGPGSCSTVSEFRVSANPDAADPASERILFQTWHSQGNHNGGWIGFGPDGFLYVSIGDGGEQGDPNNRAENLGQYQGKILRIDVDARDPGLQYAIPPSNPFVGTAGAMPEIWCYGMRNPWRDSFDRLTGDLYVADVGQNCWEEVTVLPAAAGGGSGVNLGWNTTEGRHCFNSARFGDCGFTGCAPVGQLADWDYSHSTDGCSVTGGYVYRGCRMPDWNGWYFFSDYCNEWIDAFNYADGVTATIQRVFPPGSVSSPAGYGEDANGELYVLEGVFGSGRVLRLEPQ